MPSKSAVDVNAAKAGKTTVGYLVDLLNEVGTVDAAAAQVGVSARTLYYHMRKHRIAVEFCRYAVRKGTT
ncbi:MAG: hypothetical protein AAF125_08405 [Chloroflexota bacterium]